MNHYLPQKILIDKTVSDLPFTKEILSRVPHSSKEIVEPEVIEGSIFDKHVLYLTKNKGRFFRPCPCTNKHYYLSCEYRILDVVTNCAFNCTYCILQSYLNQPFIQVYTNLGDLSKELDEIRGFYRIGTGELTDSLFLDHITQLSTYLVPYFAKRDLILELKTKSTNIENLATLNHHGHTVVSWSLNAKGVVEREEIGAPPLEERLEAARQCQLWGYPLGFHFDPIIYYPGWEEGYSNTVDLLFKYIKPEKVAWISLGALRFMPPLKYQIKRRFPKSDIIYGEFIDGLDGKKRYFKPIRIRMYSHLLNCIRKYAPHVLVYLCMELPDVWKRVFGFVPDKGELKQMLDNVFKKAS